MSAAERTARKVYREYNLGILPEDVKRQLMILFLTSPSEIDDVENSSLPNISVEALRTSAEKSYQEAVRGEGRPVDELLDELSSKYL